MPAPTISPLPSAPSRSTDPTNFSTEADAFIGALPTLVTQTNAMGAYLDGVAAAADADAAAAAISASSAADSAIAADNAANASAFTANVTPWTSGTTYAAGAAVYSLINFQTYRRISSGAGTTDPSLDAANWTLLTSYPATPFSVIGNSTAGSEIRLPEDTDNGSNYIALKAPNSLAANLTLTLPAADGTSDQVLKTDGSGNLSFGSVGGGLPLTSYTGLNTTKQLVSTDMGSILLSASTSSIIVKMPDATTLTASQRTAFLKNVNSYSIMIQDYSGNPLCILDPGDVVTLFASSIATAAGTWTSDTRLKNGVVASALLQYTSTVFDVEMYPGLIVRVCNGQNSSGFGATATKFQFITDDNGKITILSEYYPTFTPFATPGSSSTPVLGACKVDTNRFVVFFRDANGYVAYCCYEINSTNYAVKEGQASTSYLTISNIYMMYAGAFQCISHSANTFSFFYTDNNNYLASARYTGTIGSDLSLSSGCNFATISSALVGFFIAATKVNQNKVIVGWRTNNSQIAFIGIDLSSTINMGSQVLVSYYSTRVGLCAFSTTKAVFFTVSDASASSGLTYGVVEFSGTNTVTITFETSVTAPASSGVAPYIVPFGIDNSQFLGTLNIGTTVYYSKITISGGVPSFGTWTILGNTPIHSSSGVIDRTLLMPLSSRRASIRFGQMDVSSFNSCVIGILNESALV